MYKIRCRPLIIIFMLIVGSELFAHAEVGKRHESESQVYSSKQIAGVNSSGFYLYGQGRFSALDVVGKLKQIDGKKCVSGGIFNAIDVRNDYAFDIDETVELEVEFDLATTDTRDIFIAYDKQGDSDIVKNIRLPAHKENRWYKAKVTLERSRFADGRNGSDIVIGTESKTPITVCSITLKRSYTTKSPGQYGTFELQVHDQGGSPTPVRIGLYHQSGKTILPGDRPIDLLSSGAWPSENRHVFYIDGRYQTPLPVGRYQLVASKGLEYFFSQQTFDIQPSKTTPITLTMKRWENMPAKGWHTGDGHIHYTRKNIDDSETMLLQTQAEDIHVANVLQMGDVVSGEYFSQYEWKPYGSSPYLLVPGQEDPRTSRRGHTVHLNIKSPVRYPDNYLMYNKVFEQTRSQGAVVGYAHLMMPQNGNLNTGKGLILDMPFGLVDFVEVLQSGAGDFTRLWFDFLNLGYKLTPVAGTDYPLLDRQVGLVRTYVKTANQALPQAWFDGLKSGHVFVTNGPMLELSVNGKTMGEELRLQAGAPVNINVSAEINPDVGHLYKLELIEQGRVIKDAVIPEGKNAIHFSYDLKASHGTWFVVRAYGRQPGSDYGVSAYSAPIYIYVDDKGFWKPSAVLPIVDSFKQELQMLINNKRFMKPYGFEPPLTPELKRAYLSQLPLLKQQVKKAISIYDDLVEQAEDAIIVDSQ